MIEPVFSPGSEAARRDVLLGQDGEKLARDRALLWRATNLAIESAFSFGMDLPVGAAAASGNWIVGRYFASDIRTTYRQAHAEYMAIMNWTMNNMNGVAPAPDTIIVSLEPCNDCQDFLKTIPRLKRVGFGLAREEAEKRGLLKVHEETIYERALRLHLPYEVFQVEDPELQQVGGIIFDFTKRNPITEKVEVDKIGLQRALTELTAA